MGCGDGGTLVLRLAACSTESDSRACTARLADAERRTDFAAIVCARARTLTKASFDAV